ncbi:unnamed protein product, partial [Owenia fusiformis]
IIILLGIVLLYLMNFIWMISSSPITCGMKRFGIGFFYSMIFSSLLVKIVRINRFSNKMNSSNKPQFISGPSQIVATCVLIALELVLVVEWLILKPPEVEWYLVNETQDEEYPLYTPIWRCVNPKLSLVLSLCYIYVLVVLSLAFAIKARKSIEFQQEAMYICVTSLGTIVIMLAWIPVYMLADGEYETPAICIGNTVNTSLIFGMMFLPKVLALTATSPKGAAKTTKKTKQSKPTDSTIPIPQQYMEPRNSLRGSSDSGIHHAAGFDAAGSTLGLV